MELEVGRSPSGRAATPSGPSPQTVSGIAGIPNAEEVAKRLLFMAEVGDMGRRPDQHDIRRIAAALIQQMERALRTAVWNYSKVYGLADDAAITVVEAELARVFRAASAMSAGTAKTRRLRAKPASAVGNAETPNPHPRTPNHGR